MQGKPRQLRAAEGKHECEIFPGRDLEAAESEYMWNNCRKNPGHQRFISVQNFVDNYLSGDGNTRMMRKLQGMIDLTVRVRVRWTSRERPDDDGFAGDRGTDKLRMGTGFIQSGLSGTGFIQSGLSGTGFIRSGLSGTSFIQAGLSNCEDLEPIQTNGPSACLPKEGVGRRKQYRFCLQTARHVVFNTEEAKWTKVDLFYDSDATMEDGRMKTLMGVEVLDCKPGRDYCVILCATHDEEVSERILAALRDQRYPVFPQDLPCILKKAWDRGGTKLLIISHPHGQPKKITAGVLTSEWISWASQMAYFNDSWHGPNGLTNSTKQDVDNGRFLNFAAFLFGKIAQNFPMFYTAHTCPGSSGAPVFELSGLARKEFLPSVHAGMYSVKFPGEFGICSIVLNLVRRCFNSVTGQVNYCHYIRLDYERFTKRKNKIGCC